MTGRLRPNREQSTSPRLPVSSGKSFLKFSTLNKTTCPKDFHIPRIVVHRNDYYYRFSKENPNSLTSPVAKTECGA
jgi:hypothetical protein